MDRHQSKYYTTRKLDSLRYFVTGFMHNIGGDSDRRWNDSISIYYIAKKPFHELNKH